MAKRKAADTIKCEICGKEFRPKRSDTKVCYESHDVPCSICGKTVHLPPTNTREGKYRTNYYLKNGKTVTCGEQCKNELKRRSSYERYGVAHPAQLKSTQEKKKITNLERYGYEAPSQRPDIKLKIKRTYENNPVIAVERSERAARTCFERYGVSNGAQTESARKKISDARKNDTEETKAKRKHSLSMSCSSNEVIQRRKATNLKYYGYEFPAFQDPVRHKAIIAARKGIQRDLKSEIGEFIKEYPEATRPVIAEALNINYNTLQSQISRNGFVIPVQETSRFEAAMSAFLDSLGVEYQRHERKLIEPKEFDFYIPSKRLAIEVNDIASHNSTKGIYKLGAKPKMYHLYKTLAARDAGVELFHVWQWQITDIGKFEVIKSMIRQKLGMTERKIRASSCMVEAIGSKEATRFLTRCHLQDNEPFSETMALIFEGAIVAVMCFKGDELVRFCSELNTQVYGGFSKLLMAFNKKRIITFSANDYSEGAVYKKYGFTAISDVQPNYWWVKGTSVLSHWASNRKSIQKRHPDYCDYETDRRTEKELMEGLGYVQVYDSGKVKWELSII